MDTVEPSAFARGILSSQPYTFLDDAPLEERRTQAVFSRRVLDPAAADDIGSLDPDAIARVREEAWPQPESAEEIHEALLWMGFVTDEEAETWRDWLERLVAAGRVVREDGRWFAVEASRDPKAVLRGRLEALGPIESDDPLLLELEAEGVVLRTRIGGRPSGATGGSSRGSTATRSTGFAARSSPSARPSSSASWDAGSTWARPTVSRDRAASRPSPRSWPASRRRHGRGKGPYFRRGCAATSASGSTS